MPKKRFTDEELKARVAARTRAWREKNPERAKAAVKKCIAEKGKEYSLRSRQKNRQKNREIALVYHYANRERRLAYMKNYYRTSEKHAAYRVRPDIKERESKYNRAYRKANPEFVARLFSEWVKNNPGKAAARIQLRRAREIGATVGDLKEIEEFYHKVRTAKIVVCHWCKKEVQKGNRHVDHKIPLSKGGKHCVTNLLASCAFCNLSKGGKLPEEFLAYLASIPTDSQSEPAPSPSPLPDHAP